MGWGAGSGVCVCVYVYVGRVGVGEGPFNLVQGHWLQQWHGAFTGNKDEKVVVALRVCFLQSWLFEAYSF